jgi:hypothetical protein
MYIPLVGNISCNATYQKEATLPKVRFQILMAMSVNMAVFWDVAPFSLAYINQCFRAAYCLCNQGPDD